MEIVIDIDENVYTRLFDNGIQDNEIAIDDICEMARALRRGKSLPKGHGDLIDRKDLTPDADYEDGIFGAVSCQQIVEAEAIIEADTESEE